jgi:hypothetical protein
MCEQEGLPFLIFPILFNLYYSILYVICDGFALCCLIVLAYFYAIWLFSHIENMKKRDGDIASLFFEWWYFRWLFGRIEGDIFLNVNEEDIINSFMAIR